MCQWMEGNPRSFSAGADGPVSNPPSLVDNGGSNSTCRNFINDNQIYCCQLDYHVSVLSFFCFVGAWNLN